MPRKRLAHSSASSSPFRSPRRASARNAVARRDGPGALVLILAVLLLCMALAVPTLFWLLPTHPWLVLFLTVPVPTAILLFLIGHARGWWDTVVDTDPLGARDADR